MASNGNFALFLIFFGAFIISFNIVNNIYAIRSPLDGGDVRRALVDGGHPFSDVPPAPPPPVTEAEYNSKAKQAGSQTVTTAVSVAGNSKIDKLGCNGEENAEYWGELVQAPPGHQNFKNSPEECCQSCKDHAKRAAPGTRKCNTWVYCPNKKGCATSPHKSCWLKWQAKPSAPAVTRGDNIPWTSGALYQKPLERGEPGKHKTYHVVVTANAAKYVQWQCRVMYYWYKKRFAEQGPDGQMGGFTRVLHEGRGDELMEEMPTCVVDRLSQEYGFVVLSRPNALMQMLDRCKIEEDYILMAEPDHLMLRPIPNLMTGNKAAAFPFFYINPKDFKPLIRRYLEPILGSIPDEDIDAMDPVGNSPNFISKADLRKVAPLWANFTVTMKLDPECDKAWGWVLEMYSYTIAAKGVGVSHDLFPKLAAQPPWDTKLDGFYILHYTYGNDYTLDGVFTPGKIGAWRFDKRSYMGNAPPRNLSLPPKGVPETVVTLIEMINEASFNIPNWG